MMKKCFQNRIGSMNGECKRENCELFPYHDLMKDSFGMGVKIGNQVGLSERRVSDGCDG